MLDILDFATKDVGSVCPRDCQLRDVAPTGRWAQWEYAPKVRSFLIVGTDLDTRTALEAALRHAARFEPHITSVPNPDMARRAISLAAFDAILVDTQGDAEDLCDLIDDIAGLAMHAPVVLSAAEIESDIESEALAMGVSACLQHDQLSPQVLETTLRLAMRMNDLENTLRVLGRAHSPTPSECTA